MEGKGSRYGRSPDSGLPSSRRGSLLSSGRRMSVWEAGGQLEADMQIFCEKCLWRIKRDSRENKWALRLHWGSDPRGRAPAQGTSLRKCGRQQWRRRGGPCWAGTVQLQYLTPICSISYQEQQVFVMNSRPTQRCGSWRSVANSIPLQQAGPEVKCEHCLSMASTWGELSSCDSYGQIHWHVLENVLFG